MSILPTLERPFGPLNPVHEYILGNARPLTPYNAHHLILIPMGPLAAQCLLLQYPNTRHYRAALAVLGITLLIKGVVSYRFDSKLIPIYYDTFFADCP